MKLLFFFFLIPLSVFTQNDTTEQICSYPGGVSKMQQDLKKYLIYPKSAEKDKISGKCYIKFVIDTMGNPVNIKVQKSLRGDCDTAAIEAVKHLTGWNPSKTKGKKVIANMSIPITW